MALPILQRWEGESFDQVFGVGRTMPLRLGVFRYDSFGKRQTMEVLTKSIGHPEITPWQLVAELFGNQLACHFDVQTPLPLIVNLSPAFVQAVGQSGKFILQSRGLIKLQPGLAAGCHFLEGTAPLSSAIALPSEQEWARRLFAFDMLVQNPDRQTNNPNAALLNNRVVAFDYELCFSFVYAVLAQLPAWEIDPKLANTHVFHKGLAGKQQDWNPFLERLAELEL